MHWEAFGNLGIFYLVFDSTLASEAEVIVGIDQPGSSVGRAA